ncbi:hypothetical protein [Rhizobium mesoamericanum]|uniref:hypothetical protein n=1 Tax=Rhizobium mesoamericanum TaxID=1079800 RepID=UPI0004029F17|nr:hypothetical protein [Rhizobium mesoamericanum]
MNFIITTCVFSQSSKSRPLANVSEFLSRNRISVTPSTLVDVEYGIARIAEEDPAKAVELREWLKIEKDRFEIIADHSETYRKTIVKLLACKPMQGLWTNQAAAKQLAFRHVVWVAAAALANELPIATMSPRVYGEIAQHFPLPGIYDPSADAWYTRKAFGPKRLRRRRQMADNGVTVPATLI